MADTGGGKVKCKRNRIDSKPYARNTQQQSGLFGRMTDTVMSIVPSWLQNYFNVEDAPEGGGSALETDQNCQPPTPPNGSEEGPLPLDGCNSPEPIKRYTEPSTSRASLNFQDYVLSRPPLSRSHHHFPPLETSSPNLGTSSGLFSQPSTSSAPGTFSTGFSLVKEIKDNFSQHEDDNISTTSGFSSRASEKDVPTSKTASLPQLWSPEMERTQSGPQPAQSSLRKPSFNLSVFGTSSNSSLNSTVLNSSQLGDSPFYPGKTIYGGAAAVRTSRARPGTPYQAPLRRQIKAKPACAQPCGVTSATARRILQSLERMSSPLASIDGTDLDVSQTKRRRMDSSLPPVQRLMVPVAAVVSGNRSVSFRPTLTPGGVSRTLDRAPRETPTRQSPQLPEVTPGSSRSTMISSGPAYPLSSTPAASSVTSGGGKMKRERTSTRPSSKRPEEEEVAEVLDLPTISLPISAAALPTFSFSSPPPPVATNSTAPNITHVTPAKEIVSNKEPPTGSTPPSVPFTFSSPIVKATAASPPSFSPSAGFTFSAPAKLGPSMSNGKLAYPIEAAVKFATSKSTDDFEGPFKPAKALKQGSVLDLLKAPGFASPVAQPSPGPASDLLQTSTLSTTPSSITTNTISPSTTKLADVFKAPPGWDCDVCLVQNKPSDTKCVCCTAPQPSSSKPMDSKPSTATSAGRESSGTNATTTSTAGFGIMFSKPAGTWDCDTCLVEDTTCVDCTSPKPGASAGASSTSNAQVFGLGNAFKMPEGGWDCDTCLLQNKAADVQCVACQAVKPGATVEPKAFGSSAAVTSSSNSGVSKFGTSDGTSGEESVGFKFGGSLAESSSSSSSGGFKFGSTFGSSATETSSKDTTASSGFKFGSSSEGFKFGTSSSDDKKSDQSAAAPGFKFGTSGGIVFGTGSSNTESNSSKGGFTFGLSKPEEKTADTTTIPSSRSFTPPAPSQEKSEVDASSNDTTSTTIAGSVFGSLATTTPQGGSTFGTLQKDKEPAAPTFTFGKPEEKKEAAASSAPSAFLFGAASKDTDAAAAAAAPAAAVSGGFSFSKPSALTEQPPPAYNFGKSAEKSETAEAPNPSFGFGQSAADSSTAPKRGFSFMVGNATNTVNSTTSSSTTPTPSLFGTTTIGTIGSSSIRSSTAPAPSAAPSTFMFGQTAATSNDAPPAKAFVFGQSQDSQPSALSAAPLNSTPTPVPAQPFFFGAPASAAAAPAAAAAAAAAAPSFGFGAAAPTAASTTAPSAAPSPFAFSPAPSSGFGASQTSSFGSSFGSPFPAAPSQPPAFGAKPNATPVFGQQTNATPVFGAAANSTQGQQDPSAPLLQYHQRLPGERSRQRCGAESRAMRTRR
ncbi:Nuclear pore complex protein Nup153 [Liparis tanakae]|uniref:Nuclear pore complex protein Nup153 n=1 Tax=Liparis tanakae TaxID=230148 RepID=A0A4Z2H8T6_9TELE|nr:Nuclear pore complex protein Nup153 [Liparis tanakae]